MSSFAYLSDPWSCQAYGIARLLHFGYEDGPRAVAVSDARFIPGWHNTWYRAVVSSNVAGSRAIPMGADSTRKALSRGPINLGSVVMDSSMLAAYDKASFLEIAADSGVPVPRQWADATSSIFPVFYKEANEVGGGRRGIARSIDELPSASGKDLLLQEYIDSVGTYGVAFVAHKGSVRHFTAHFERTSFPSSGGSAVAIEQFESPRLIELTRILIDRFGMSGWGIAEFKWDSRVQDYVLMEINAKFWASVEFSMRNSPEMFRELFGVQPGLGPIRRAIYVNRLIGLLPGLRSARGLQGASAKLLYPNATRYLRMGIRSRLSRA